MTADDARLPSEEDATAAARNRVLAALDARAEQEDDARPLGLTSNAPLKEPDAALAAKIAARRQEGLTEEGVDHPRRKSAFAGQTALLVIGTGGLLAMLATALVAAVTVGLAAVQVALIAIGVLVIAAGGGAIGFAAHSATDPLRLTAEDRENLQKARTWRSAQPWVGPPAGGRERRLVLLARDTVARIVASEAWTSADLEIHRAQLDLPSELDQIDRQAYELAVARLEDDGEESNEAVEHGWQALVDRVAALDRYADNLNRLHEEIVEEQAAMTDLAVEDRNAGLLAAAARDDFAADRISDLAEDLSVRKTYRSTQKGKLTN